MPELLGFATLANFMVKKNNKVLNDVLKSQPFSDMAQSLKINLEPNEIEYKFKSLLRNVALGMVPKTDWNGIPTADGGYLIVKKDLSIVCLHIFNYGEFSNYLFKQVYLETPSTTVHDFGYAYKNEGKIFFKVNSQLRFRV